MGPLIQDCGYGQLKIFLINLTEPIFSVQTRSFETEEKGPSFIEVLNKIFEDVFEFPLCMKLPGSHPLGSKCSFPK